MDGFWSALSMVLFDIGLATIQTKEMTGRLLRQPKLTWMKIEERFIRDAITLAQQARARGNHPFGALLVIDGRSVLTAENTVNTEANPTGHAENNLIQKAVQELAPEQLKNATLYSSCEPCAMCTGAMYWAGVRKVVYALSCEALAKLTGNDFLIPCRELFARAQDRVEVSGPFLLEEAHRVHEGFWEKRQK